MSIKVSDIEKLRGSIGFDTHKTSDFQSLQTEINGGAWDKMVAGVLNYKVLDFHRRMFEHQLRYPWTLTIAPRDMGKCLEGDTLLQLLDGRSKKIKDIECGEMIICIDPHTFKLKRDNVVNKFKRVGEAFHIKTRRGKTITASSNHPFMSGEGWAQLSDFSIGDSICLSRKINPITREWGLTEASEAKLLGIRVDGNYRKSKERLRRIRGITKTALFDKYIDNDVWWDEVVSIESAGKIDLYDIQTEKYHNFIANHFISHNSVICNTSYHINQINKDKNYRIGVVSKTKPKAQGLLRLTRKHFEQNKLLAAISGVNGFVEKNDESWSATELTIKGRTEIYSEPTLTAMGIQGTLVSSHYDELIPDDLVDENNSTGKPSRDLITFFNKELLPMLNPYERATKRGGELHVIGTRFCDEDLYQYLIDSGEFEVLVIPCYYNKLTGKQIDTLEALESAKKSGYLESIWPDRFPVEELEKRRRLMGNGDFFSQYMGNINYYIKQLDEKFIMDNVLPFQKIPEEYEHHSVIGAIDLSTGKPSGDYFVCGCGVCPEEGPMFLLDVFRDKIKGEDAQADIIAQMNEVFKVSSWALEGNGYQYTLLEKLEERGLNVDVFYTSKGKKYRFNKLRGIIDYRGVRYKRNMRQCIKELADWPDTENDDFVDFLDFLNMHSDYNPDYSGGYDAIEL